MLRANRPIIAYFDAIKNLRIRQVALILKAGYDPNLLVNARGQNGLQFMINYFGATEAHFRLQVPINKRAYLSLAKLLLDSGLDANATDLLTDETVLFDAIRFDDREMVALLLSYSDLAMRNKNGETALMCAARFGSKQVVRIILDHLRQLEMDGYFLRQRNRFGMTALELARAENLEAAKVLAKHLIAYGQHTGAVLARSASHHQLVEPRAGPSGAQATTAAICQPPGALLRRQASRPDRRHVDLFPVDPVDCYSLASEFSDSSETGLYAPQRSAATRAPRASYRPYFDPKAAEFSAYLLEKQQQIVGDSAGGNGRGEMNARASDDDEYGGAMLPPPPGQLMRSRSCMLAQTASSDAAPKQTTSMGGQKKSAAGGSFGGNRTGRQM